ncbi:cytochrome P450 [Favolaschia claudopus]|uniref:Cytochrome P450 n=1 Tax=Favolaschia claudopus TaxID=2862362 RepID=A0AAV9ZLJ8_9AGAR
MLHYSTLLVLILTGAAILLTLRKRRRPSLLSLPPGPKGLPLVGHLFTLPLTKQWETYAGWSQQLGSDIIHLDIAGSSIIVLSSTEAVKELFERRSSLYSDRPESPMRQLMGWGFSVGFMKYGAYQYFSPHVGERWRAHRKLLHDAFNTSANKQFHAQERAAAQVLLRRILQDPHSRCCNVMEHFRHLAGSLVMDITYGIDVRETEDPYINIAEKAMYGLSVASVPGAFLVESLPVLKYVPDWLPGAAFKRKAEEWKKWTCDLLEVPFKETQRNMSLGKAKPSFVSLNLHRLEIEDMGNTEDDKKESVIRGTAGSMYAAGSDTTVAALGTFVLAILLNPDVQQKAQAELDTVLGPGLLPDFSDRDTLPYVTAIVKETLRWRPVTPMAIPHYLSVDDEYRGYRIPAKSVIIGNAWAILHDENMYPNPDNFNPERFLLNGKLNPEMRDPEAAFGFGRRICPGRHVATSTLWITVASILSTFSIRKAKKEDGEVIEPTNEYLPGLVSLLLKIDNQDVVETGPRIGTSEDGLKVRAQEIVLLQL